MQTAIDFHRWKQNGDGSGGEQDLAETIQIRRVDFVGPSSVMGSRSSGHGPGRGARARIQASVNRIEGNFAKRPDTDGARFEFDGGHVEPAAVSMGGGDSAERLSSDTFRNESLERGGVEDG